MIHVAGTNGKGSTVAYLRAVLERAGLRVHTFTSPYLVRINECFRLAGGLVGDLVGSTPGMSSFLGRVTYLGAVHRDDGEILTTRQFTAAPTLRQDQAELARLESKSDAQSSDSRIADLRTTEARADLERPMTPSPASEEPATTVNLPTKEDSSLKTAQSKAVASRSHASRSSRLRRYQAELALQRQRAIVASQYRYAQQESGSFFSSIARALGLSGR